MSATELIIIAAIGTAGLLIGELQQYSEIKDRKGKLVNGVYIKEADLTD